MTEFLTVDRGIAPDWEAEGLEVGIYGPILMLGLDDGEALVCKLEDFEVALEREKAKSPARARSAA